MIFDLHLGVGHSVLCQMGGVGHVFSNHHIFKCSGPCRFVWPIIKNLVNGTGRPNK